MIESIRAALFGLAVGDALGVPVEFKERDYLKKSPVTEMLGYGTWQQPIGTWSDDSSLAFCLAESLCKGYNLEDIAANFIQWKEHGYWGAHHRLFDIGMATSGAIHRLSTGVPPVLAGGMDVDDNGNGSLMRILPLLFYLHDMPVEQRYEKIKEVSSLTHAHFRSVFACFIYLEFALAVIQGKARGEIYAHVQKQVNDFVSTREFNDKEIRLFDRILNGQIYQQEEKNIQSGGYVLHTLEASLWCSFNSGTYKEAVLKAVNLGGDTDTTACVTGGLAGLMYGYDSIPAEWIKVIARRNDIEDLCNRLDQHLKTK